MEVSRCRLDFGVLKSGYAYRADGIVLSNKTDRCRYRWRIASNSKMARCVTPRGWLAPRLSVNLVFEFEATQLGSFSFGFDLSGQDGSSWRIEMTAVVVDSVEFRSHVGRARKRRDALVSRCIRDVRKLPSTHALRDTQPTIPVSDEDHEEEEDEEEEGIVLPRFPSSVYDPRTLTMGLDPTQLRVNLDPTSSLEDVLARNFLLSERRRKRLEDGGFVTTRQQRVS